MKKSNTTIKNLCGESIPAYSFIIKTKVQSKKYNAPIGTWMMTINKKDV